MVPMAALPHLEVEPSTVGLALQRALATLICEGERHDPGLTGRPCADCMHHASHQVKAVARAIIACRRGSRDGPQALGVLRQPAGRIEAPLQMDDYAAIGNALGVLEQLAGTTLRP